MCCTAIDISTRDGAGAMPYRQIAMDADRHLTEGPRSRRRVLVIEDDFLISSIVRDELVEHGYEVIGPAASVEQALLLADAAAIDAALVDLGLRSKFPYDAIALLTQRRVPFIFMTAYTTIPEGFDRAAPILKKPFTLVQLIAALEGILPACPGA
jgi:chemotaxis family two-component system sensor kinase Cph1